ncbi:MAG: SusC/RagA family TonB-linked outer membrane protein, partial [Bacteroidales bacterium]
VLESASENLDEVIVVAYGTTKKASFTGSASVVKSQEVASQKESLVKSLSGKVAGVRVGGSTGDAGSDQDIVIRGISSISGTTSPLYVIDGVPIVSSKSDMTTGLRSQSVMSSINPEDIESLTILKDAAASSLYGSRAANGVIIITTKQGKSGKTKITYNMESGWTDLAVKGQYTPMNAKEVQDYYRAAGENLGILNPALANKASTALLGVPFTTPEELGQNIVNGYFWNPGSDIDTNWKKEVFRKGMITDHQVAISGGSEKTRFYTGFGYNKTLGLIKGSEFERFSGRMNIDHKAFDWLRIGARQLIAYTNQHGFRDQNEQEQGFGTSSPMSILFSMDPTAKNILEDGSYNPNGGFSSQISNPNLMLGQTTGPNAETIRSNMMRSLSNFEAEVTLPLGFNVKSIFGYDYMNNKEQEFWAPGSVNGQSLGGLGYRADFTSKTLTSSTTVNYVNSFDKHNIRALVGYEIEDRNLLIVEASAKSYSTDKLPELSNGQSYNTGSSESGASIQSVLANANYDYDNKYYLSGSFRRDGSSRLGKNNRWANFWSVSAAWRLTGEDFLEANPLFTDLKLRASYGTNGNLPPDYYANLALYSFSGGYGEESGIYWNNAGNPDLGWEKSKNLNIGIDWTLYERVNLSLEYYDKTTTDLLFEVPTSWLTGFEKNWQNLGKMRNNGIELTVSSTNIQTKDFTWTTDLNLTRQWIKIKELPKGNDVMYGDGNMYLLRENESMHSFYLPQWLGVNSQTGLGEFYIDPDLKSRDAVIDGKFVADGNITNYYSKAGKTIVGKAVPDWMGGITNTFRYKNFDLSFLITFQTGASLFDYPGYFLTYSDGIRMGSFNISKEVAGNYWTAPGDNAEFPRPIWQNPYRSDRFSSRTVRSTDNVRMRDITFGYKIPIPSKYINNLRVFFKTNNPFMIYCATKNIDPDVNVNGYRQTDTPMAKSFMFGLNFDL